MTTKPIKMPNGLTFENADYAEKFAKEILAAVEKARDVRVKRSEVKPGQFFRYANDQEVRMSLPKNVRLENSYHVEGVDCYSVDKTGFVAKGHLESLVYRCKDFSGGLL